MLWALRRRHSPAAALRPPPGRREADGEPLAFCGMHTKERFSRMRDALVEGRALEPGAEEGEEEEGEEGMDVVSRLPCCAALCHAA